ncbi:unnamed protein product [Blepharisma stoltei]|uniref:Uncharacterized protein n=1 Tax=Blepharisma stoltei TaxID=1481888 RepID=A0AAU9K4T3_9CILI|nr:unnamed protein product [Blepharisma stoltei]
MIFGKGKEKHSLKKFQGNGYSKVLELFHQKFLESKLKDEKGSTKVIALQEKKITHLNLTEELEKQIQPRRFSLENTKSSSILKKSASNFLKSSKNLRRNSSSNPQKLPSISSYKSHTETSIPKSRQKQRINAFPNRRNSSVHHKYSNFKKSAIRASETKTFWKTPVEATENKVKPYKIDESCNASLGSNWQNQTHSSSSRSSTSLECQDLSYDYIYDRKCYSFISP